MVRDIFILFIDNYTRFMYLYLLFDKSEISYAFKVYNREVEQKKEKKIKIVKSFNIGLLIK